MGTPHFLGAHLHDRPPSPCSSRGDDFWGNPEGGHRRGREMWAMWGWAQPLKLIDQIFPPKPSFLTPPTTCSPAPARWRGPTLPYLKSDPPPLLSWLLRTLEEAPAHLYSLCNPWTPFLTHIPALPCPPQLHWHLHAPSPPHTPIPSPPAHLPGHAQGDVALLTRVQDLQLKVVAAGAERPPGLGQPHIHDALPLPHILQHLGQHGAGSERGETGHPQPGPAPDP